MNQHSLLGDDVGGIPLAGASREKVRMQMMRSQMPVSPWIFPDKPDDLPDLSGAEMIGVDIESKDPHLHTLGPGFVRGDASVVGVAIHAVFSNRETFTRYYPLRHENGRNLEPTRVLPWLVQQLRGAQPKIGANLLYDLEGLHFDGVPVAGPLWDVTVAGPLLDEDKDSYALDVVAKELLGRGKDEAMLEQVARIIGCSKKPADVKKNLYKIPCEYVGPYAEEDARLGVECVLEQKKLLEKESLIEVFDKESRLIPLLLKMRVRGVRVDLDKAVQVNETLKRDELDKQRRLDAMVGFHLDVWSPLDLRRACLSAGLAFNRTGTYNKKLEDNNPSFTADWLKSQHAVPFLKLVGEIRKMSKMRRDFVEGFVLNLNVRGRLHCQFHQLRRTSDDEEGKEGTRSGRFSSTNPNLQQIPARDPVYGPMVRGLFVPEIGSMGWGCFDYSAQEPRATLHYAFLRGFPGAAAAVERYKTDPSTDYHQMVADYASIKRKEAKEINLGLAYGMGFRKLGWKLGFWTEKQAMDRSWKIPTDSGDSVTAILNKYHEGAPFIKPLMEELTRVADQRGFIRTLWGRRRRFDEWEPRNKDDGWGAVKGLDAARTKFGDVPLRRASTHKALNALIQGTSADMMKQAMLDVGDLGYVPHITCHDEIDDTIFEERQFREISEVMVNAMSLAVPLKVDAKLVPDWGKAK